jgi:glc operon protein GlcG
LATPHSGQLFFDIMLPMPKLIVMLLSAVLLAAAVELPTKKYLNLAALKMMARAAEAEAEKRNVQVTICIVDDGGNLLYLQKADGAGLNTVEIAQKKARYAALYGRPSATSAQQLKEGNLSQMIMPNGFPVQGGLPVKVDGKTIGAVACSGAASEVDEAISQVAIDAILK